MFSLVGIKIVPLYDHVTVRFIIMRKLYKKYAKMLLILYQKYTKIIPKSYLNCTSYTKIISSSSRIKYTQRWSKYIKNKLIYGILIIFRNACLLLLRSMLAHYQ